MADDEEETTSRPLTLGRRVGLVERDVRSHARSIGEIVKAVEHYDTRFRALEEWKTAQQLSAAREDERDTYLTERLARIELSIADIKSGWMKAFWIVAATVIPAAVLGVALALVFGTKLIPG